MRLGAGETAALSGRSWVRRRRSRFALIFRSASFCAAQAEELTEMQERVDSVLQTQAEAPVRLEARVMEAVRALPAPRTSWRTWLLPPGGRLIPNWKAAALCLTALCLIAVVFAASRFFPRKGQVLAGTLLRWT